MASITPGIERRLARSAGVRAVTRRVAAEIAAAATVRLDAHRARGEHQIVVTHGPIDSEVSLVGPGAVSVEFGRGGYTRADGQYVGPMDGLHILSGALHDVAGR